MNTNESKTSTGPSRRSGPGKATLLTALLAITASSNTLLAQSNSPKTVDPQAIERLRRDQDEIMRKAESLKKLMTRLMTRYQRENKQEQVDYLKEGLKHLDRSGILRDVATIREDLEATAFTEALRKQKEVVNDLERLLNILLARKSIENIDEEVKAVAKQAQTAAELERRTPALAADIRADLLAGPQASAPCLRAASEAAALLVAAAEALGGGMFDDGNSAKFILSCKSVITKVRGNNNGAARSPANGARRT